MYLLDMLEPGCSSSQSVREDTERDFKTADEAQESISSSTDEEEEVRSLQFKGQIEVNLETLDTKPHDLLSVDPGLWPTKLSDKDRATIVTKLAQREEREMPHDSEGKPFPDYLKHSKAANGREKMCSCGSVVEHCVSSAKGCGFDSQGTHLLMKMYNLNVIVSRFG